MASVPPSTPPRQGPSSSVLSSPVVRVPKFYDEHKRDEFQLFGYVENIHEPIPFENQEKFIQFLRVQSPDFPISGFRFTLDDFVNVANAMAKLIQEKSKYSFFLFWPLANVSSRFCEEAPAGIQEHGGQPSTRPRNRL
jgi:hypothetical protein